ncbi:Rho GTPase activation protein [Syncephalastrum racemosum]|uniref:Rho GTPase activation protein n=1 Tax=Syncephalastrum racemosum TaxID=13706 RepID=A0A1X2H9G9_SYNRA|nr:Rho GTPase activation protein [Syncephalastrum racemosum]
MDFEGLYRKSGGSNIMRELQAVFDKGQIPDLFDDKWGDICSVTSTLKMYFRELPDPLFTYQAHAQFMRAAALADRNNHIIPRLHGLLHALPEAHFAVISYLMKHLDRVQQHQEYNLMNRKNLALVFGPTLLRNQDDNADLTEMNLKIKIVDLILEHYDQLLL